MSGEPTPSSYLKPFHTSGQDEQVRCYYAGDLLKMDYGVDGKSSEYDNHLQYELELYKNSLKDILF